MKLYRQVFGIAFFVVAVLGAIGWLEVFKWDECRKVGHSKFYCILTQGSK